MFPATEPKGSGMTLQFLIVGTGRDGTVSLTHVINEIFRLNHIKGTAAHEYLARECYNAYCLAKETGDGSHLRTLRKQIENCPYEAIVGNGYASLLPLFREIFPNLALIHVQRRDRDAVVQSHLKNSLLFPQTYIYYGATDGDMRRTAAFHEGEMSRAAWDTLPIKEKFGWFYCYTHRAIAAEAPKFSRHLTVYTESLSEADTLAALTQFITGRKGSAPGAAHLNRHAYLSIEDFSESGRLYAQWLFGKLSASDIERDHVYLADYVTNKYIALAGYQMSGIIKDIAPACAASREEILDSLSRFEDLMHQRLKEVQLLKAELIKKRA